MRATKQHQASSVHRLRWIGLGAVIGAGAYALLDPRRGAARRAMIRDKVASFRRQRAEEAERRTHDEEMRMRGAAFEAAARDFEAEVPDHVLEERVRAQIGRPVSHPGALRIQAISGYVEIGGPILAHEVEELLRTIRQVRGVKDVVNRLEVHLTPGNVPALQGSGSRQAH
jgi:hypothetical protein